MDGFLIANRILAPYRALKRPHKTYQTERAQKRKRSQRNQIPPPPFKKKREKTKQGFMPDSARNDFIIMFLQRNIKRKKKPLSRATWRSEISRQQIGSKCLITEKKRASRREREIERERVRAMEKEEKKTKMVDLKVNVQFRAPFVLSCAVHVILICNCNARFNITHICVCVCVWVCMHGNDKFILQPCDLKGFAFFFFFCNFHTAL